MGDARRGLAAVRAPLPGADGRPPRGGNPRGQPAPVEQAPKTWDLKRFDFTVQFIWQPKSRSERQAEKAAGEAEAVTTAGL